MRGLTKSVANLISILATPTDSFVDLKEQPRWVLAFIIFTLLSSAVAWMLIPLAEQLAFVNLSGRLSEQQIEQTLSWSSSSRYISLVFIPIRFLIKWLALASLLYFLSVLLDARELRFRTLYVVVVYSETILILMLVVNVLLIYIRGIESVQNVTDLQVIMGLDVFLKNKAANLALFTLLNSVNVFSIWYLATLTIGISIVTDFSKLKAGILVTSVWLLGVSFQVALIAITSNFSASMGG